MEQFQYTTLESPDHIRLVAILPPYKHSEDAIDENLTPLKLTTELLQDAATYQALSYTWGDPSVKRRILINHGVLDMTENLALALQ